MEFKILQLKNTPETREYRFSDLAYLSECGLTVQRKNYEVTYDGIISRQGSHMDILERLYMIFNVNRPKDFHGHSMSVSDVVILKDTAGSVAYYCDSVGFEKIAFPQDDTETM